MIISRLPLLIFPKETTPSISETAGFEGLRASIQVILGKPPVISPDLEETTNFNQYFTCFYFLTVFNHQVGTVSYKNESTHHLYRKLVK
jgi:hypothetical protein